MVVYLDWKSERLLLISTSELPSTNSTLGELGEQLGSITMFLIGTSLVGLVQNRQDQCVGMLHLQRTGRPTVNTSRMTMSMMVMVTTIGTPLTMTMTLAH